MKTDLTSLVLYFSTPNFIRNVRVIRSFLLLFLLLFIYFLCFSFRGSRQELFEHSVLSSVFQSLPNFGPYMKERREIVAKHKEKSDLLSDDKKPEPVRPVPKPSKSRHIKVSSV